MLRYREIQPSLRLRPIVSAFWILEHDGLAATPQRVVPDGRSELILNWNQPFESFQAGRWQRQPRIFLAGQLDGPLLLRPCGPASMLGIRFHPDGAARLLGQPVDEFSGRIIPIDLLSPALQRDFEGALESPDPIVAVESALLRLENMSRGADLLVGEAVLQITLARGNADLGGLARELGISARQFERRFLARVGLPPKLFCRIQRFNNILRAIEQERGSWVETALACGYYDQAHLIRDCRSLSGETPSVLYAEDADLARHFYSRSDMSHLSNTARRVVV
jgi:AraC-like DNA-binding protein